MKKLFYSVLILTILSCSSKNEMADTIISGGVIYTVEKNTPTVEAVAIKDGKILFAGTLVESEKYKNEKTKSINLEGKIMTPGWIEGHGHFMGLGMNELELDLMYVKNYDELVAKVKEAVEKAKPGEWILGRGWHQSKWDKVPEKLVNGFQTHDKLSEISPDNPVYLSHASGHAGFANAKAMEIAGVNQLSIETLVEDLEGGEILKDELGNPTGIFSERAQALIYKYIPSTSEEKAKKALELAVAACYRNGITSFHDAGVGQETIDLYKESIKDSTLGIRLYAMISGPNRELTKKWLAKGPEIDTTNYLLTIRSIKLNCDGALGNRGAWLLEEYSDRPGHFGMETLPMDYVQEISEKGLARGFQVCSHAIGDRANKEIMDRYENAFKKSPELAKDSRFRIEHAQHMHPDEIPRFGKLGVIPAMQAVHLSSDRPWAIDRLGEKRIKEGAYMWQSLIKGGAIIVNGTDVPVEPVNPLASFYAAVTRKTLAGTPEGGYEPEEKMTREQALESYTINCAFGAFEENIKGSIKVGKLADFTVFDKDLMIIPENEILETKIAMTIFNGDIVYTNN